MMSDIGETVGLTAVRQRAAEEKYLSTQQVLIGVFLGGESTSAALGAGMVVEYRLQQASELAYCALQRVYESRQGLYVDRVGDTLKFSKNPFLAEC